VHEFGASGTKHRRYAKGRASVMVQTVFQVVRQTVHRIRIQASYNTDDPR